MNEHMRALEDYTRVIELDASSAYAYYNRGIVDRIQTKCDR